MQITRSSIATGTSSADWFTSHVYVDTVTQRRGAPIEVIRPGDLVL